LLYFDFRFIRGWRCRCRGQETVGIF
jgi:hypothetical protein